LRIVVEANIRRDYPPKSPFDPPSIPLNKGGRGTLRIGNYAPKSALSKGDFENWELCP